MFFAHGATPSCRSVDASRLKNGVVLLVKRWWPLMARLEGVRVDCVSEVRLNCSATLGRSASRSG